MLVCLPASQDLFLLIVLLSGLNKVDFYHMMYLVMFVLYLILPKRKHGITKVLIIYSSVFVVIKHLYVLLNGYLKDSTKEFLEVMGFATSLPPDSNWRHFYLKFYPQQWIVVVAGYFQAMIIQFYSEKEVIKKCVAQAHENLKTRFPGTNSVLQKLFTVKRKALIALIFAGFYVIIVMMSKSLIYWGFLLLTNLLIYMHISGQAEHSKTSTLRRTWYTMVTYSSLVILTNLVHIFLSIPFIKKMYYIVRWWDAFPRWIKDHPEMLGLISLEEHEAHNYTAFMPFLAFFILSVYISRQIKQWRKQDALVRQELQRLDANL